MTAVYRRSRGRLVRAGRIAGGGAAGGVREQAEGLLRGAEEQGRPAGAGVSRPRFAHGGAFGVGGTGGGRAGEVGGELGPRGAGAWGCLQPHLRAGRGGVLAGELGNADSSPRRSFILTVLAPVITFSCSILATCLFSLHVFCSLLC